MAVNGLLNITAQAIKHGRKAMDNIALNNSRAEVPGAHAVDKNGVTIEKTDTSTKGKLVLETMAGCITGSDLGIVINELDSANAGNYNEENMQEIGRGFSHYFGFNNFFVINDKDSTIKVRSDIESDFSQLSVGKISNKDSRPLIASSSSEVLAEFEKLSQSLSSITDSGLIPNHSSTFHDYSIRVMSYISNQILTSSNEAAITQSVVERNSKSNYCKKQALTSMKNISKWSSSATISALIMP